MQHELYILGYQSMCVLAGLPLYAVRPVDAGVPLLQAMRLCCIAFFIPSTDKTRFQKQCYKEDQRRQHYNGRPCRHIEIIRQQKSRYSRCQGNGNRQ